MCLDGCGASHASLTDERHAAHVIRVQRDARSEIVQSLCKLRPLCHSTADAQWVDDYSQR